MSITFLPVFVQFSSWPIFLLLSLPRIPADKKSALGHGLSLRHVPDCGSPDAIYLLATYVSGPPFTIVASPFVAPHLFWPWFVNLTVAFCMIARHFRCKTLSRILARCFNFSSWSWCPPPTPNPSHAPWMCPVILPGPSCFIVVACYYCLPLLRENAGWRARNTGHYRGRNRQIVFWSNLLRSLIFMGSYRCYLMSLGNS